MLRRSLGQFSRATSPGLDHPVDQARHAAGRQRHVGAQLAHGEAALGGAPDVDQHVEEDQRDADVLLELAAERVGQLAVRADDEPHQADAVVVDLAQEATRAARLVQVSGRAQALAGAHCSPVLVTAHLRDRRRPHVAFLSLPEIGANAYCI